MSRKTWTDEKLFFRLLNNKTNKTYSENLSELRSRDNKIVFERSVSLVQSNVLKQRLIGIELLSQLGISTRPFLKPTLKLFFGLLKKDKDPEILSTILYGIGHNNEHVSEQEIKLICSFKKHEHTEVRQGLTFALGGNSSKPAIETLIELSKDKNDWVRDWATFGIGSQSEVDSLEVRKALWERISDKYVFAHEEAIYGLAKRKDPEIKQILAEELSKIDHHGSYILEAIEVFEDKDFIPLLKKKIRRNKIQNTINEAWLKKSLKVLESLKADIHK
jgi:hypothetical protein